MFRRANIQVPKPFILVHIHRDGALMRFRAGKISTRQQELSSYDSLDEMLEQLSTSLPYILHVSGSGVLQRQVEIKPNYLNELLINGKKEDFFVSSLESFDGRSALVSFFRRELIQELLEFLKEKRVRLYQIDSGEIQLIRSLGRTFSLKGNYAIDSNAKGELSMQKTENPGKLIYARDAAYSYDELLIAAYLNFSPEQKEHWNYSFLESEFNDRIEIAEKRKFERFGMLSVFTILFLVLVNYFYQNYLQNEVARLESELLVQNDNLALLDRLDQEKERKKLLVTSAGTISKRFSAYYLDQIGASVPDKIVLNKLGLFPIDGKLKQKQKVLVKSDLITIEGNTASNKELDKWIGQLDRKEWVHQVEVMNYVKNDSLPAEFSLQIKIKE